MNQLHCREQDCSVKFQFVDRVESKRDRFVVVEIILWCCDNQTSVEVGRCSSERNFNELFKRILR